MLDLEVTDQGHQGTIRDKARRIVAWWGPGYGGSFELRPPVVDTSQGRMFAVVRSPALARSIVLAACEIEDPGQEEPPELGAPRLDSRHFPDPTFRTPEIEPLRDHSGCDCRRCEIAQAIEQALKEGHMVMLRPGTGHVGDVAVVAVEEVHIACFDSRRPEPR